MDFASDFEKLLAETLAARGRSPRTQETYVWMLRLFARQLKKPLDAVVPEDVQNYQRYLTTERKVDFSSFNQTTCALRFFYRECLGKTDWVVERMPYQRKRCVLPEILAPEEVAAPPTRAPTETPNRRRAVAGPAWDSSLVMLRSRSRSRSNAEIDLRASASF